jgi:DHA1 family bicyclomycin/chloramphenicol resistance-like MFS transporter
MSEPSFVEFVVLIALVMGLISLSIDNLLPAFEPIRQDFGIADANELQLILTAYMAGFSLMQLVWGPLSDVVGRRPVLMLGLAIYTGGTLLAMLAHSFEVLLAARLIQGLGGAAARVLAVTIVRDRFEGRDMARVMSLTMMIFIIVPVIAPATGSLFLMLGGWHLIFGSMLALVLVVVVWFGLRMPETLRPQYRLALSASAIGRGMRRTLTTRAAIGNATAMGLMMACLMTYLNSSQQIFETEVFRLGHWFPLAFALIATSMGAASFANARLVRRLGMRRLSHGGLCGFIAVSALLLITALIYRGLPPLLLFGPALALAHFLLSLTLPNFNAMAMEPLGDIAGTASAFLGFYTTLLGALGGLLLGQAFNGTVIPLAAGYCGFSLTGLLVILWTERGHLFAPHHPDPSP